MIYSSSSLFTLNDGHTIPAIGLGTYKNKDENEVHVAVKAAYEAGYRHIDSAVVYKNEQYIGQTTKDFAIPREELFITTKIAPDDMSYEATLKSIDQSLENFITDYLDLVLIHRPGAQDLEHRLATRKALEAAKQSGKIRSIGVSNFLPHHLDTILEHCTILPAVNQFELHPLFIDRDTINACKQHNILVQAYSPFARMDEKLMMNPVVLHISYKYDKKPNQIIVRRCLQHGRSVLPKSVTPARIADNIDIDDFELTTEDVSSLDALNCDYKISRDPRTITF